VSKREPDRSTDEEVAERFRAYRRTGDPQLRDELIEEHAWVAAYCARRFAGRGEPVDDLRQVASLGLVKAVERFDPEYGSPFLTFAMPTVLGELRRYFRDATWSVRVPRRAKDLYVEMNRSSEQLRQRLGRNPTLPELAEELDASLDDVIAAFEAGSAYRPAPLDTSPDDERSGEAKSVLGGDDVDLIGSDTRLTIRSLLDDLPERERSIVVMRFFGGLTQSEIAARVGLSQVQVSRLLRQMLERMRSRLEAHDEV
jgi:RNA polymerase sigma-B factor